jgi:RimJ/RimL family protein N-acetyltransferase
MNFSITRAQTSEAKNLIDLMYSCGEELEREGFLEFSKLPKEKQLEKIELHIKTNSVYIIKSGNKIIATLSIIKLNPLIFDKKEDYENYFNNNSFNHIGALLVAKEHRKKGLAKMLVNHIEKVAKGEGIDFLNAKIGIENEDSIKIAEKLGFKKLGQGTTHRKKYACYFYEKRIN